MSPLHARRSGKSPAIGVPDIAVIRYFLSAAVPFVTKGERLSSA